jgi:hypothetical protein
LSKVALAPGVLNVAQLNRREELLSLENYPAVPDAQTLPAILQKDAGHKHVLTKFQEAIKGCGHIFLDVGSKAGAYVDLFLDPSNKHKREAGKKGNGGLLNAEGAWNSQAVASVFEGTGSGGEN